MAGQPKRGLDFVYWGVHALDENEKYDELIDAYDWVGFSVYFYISMKIYSVNGYYYEWNDRSAAHIARRMGGCIKADTVKQVVSLCLEIGLFDEELFRREGVLSGREIQLRYMDAIEKRSLRGRTVIEKYWLLSPKETKSYIVVPSEGHTLPPDEHSLSVNDTKESKANKSKENESKAGDRKEGAAAPYSSSPLQRLGEYGNIILTTAEYDKLTSEYGTATVKEYIRRADEYAEKHGRTYTDSCAIIRKWITEDAPGRTVRKCTSFDLDEYKQLANTFEVE